MIRLKPYPPAPSWLLQKGSIWSVVCVRCRRQGLAISIRAGYGDEASRDWWRPPVGWLTTEGPDKEFVCGKCAPHLNG